MVVGRDDGWVRMGQGGGCWVMREHQACKPNQVRLRRVNLVKSAWAVGSASVSHSRNGLASFE